MRTYYELLNVETDADKEVSITGSGPVFPRGRKHILGSCKEDKTKGICIFHDPIL